MCDISLCCEPVNQFYAVFQIFDYGGHVILNRCLNTEQKILKLYFWNKTMFGIPAENAANEIKQKRSYWEDPSRCPDPNLG